MAYYVCGLDKVMGGKNEGMSWNIFDTKGSSYILVLGSESVFIPKKHVKKDRNGNNTIFINTEWEYSKCNSHYDEVNHKYVREPITYIKGNELLSFIQCYTIYVRQVKFKPKEVKQDNLPF